MLRGIMIPPDRVAGSGWLGIYGTAQYSVCFGASCVAALAPFSALSAPKSEFYSEMRFARVAPSCQSDAARTAGGECGEVGWPVYGPPGDGCGRSDPWHAQATLSDDVALDFVRSAGDRAGERTQEVEHRAAERLFRQQRERLTIHAADTNHERAEPLAQYRRGQLDD